MQQARSQQRKALTLAKAITDQQAAALKDPPIIYTERDRKLPDFRGGQIKSSDQSVEERDASMKSVFQVMKASEEDCIKLVKQYLKDEAKATLKFMLGRERTLC